MISIEDPFGEAMVGKRLAHYLSARFERHTTIESVKRFTAGFSWMTYGFVAVYSDADDCKDNGWCFALGHRQVCLLPTSRRMNLLCCRRC